MARAMTSARSDRGFSALVGRPWFWALAVGFLFGLPLVRVFTRTPPTLPEVRGAVPDFTLTRETGAPFTAKDLESRVWVVSLFHPQDGTRAMKAMHTLERRMRKLGDGFVLVSLAVDPVRDTRERMAAYAREHKTHPRRWVFLTPKNPAERDALKAIRAQVPVDPSRLAMDPLVLVDGRRRVRGVYDVNLDEKPAPDAALEQLVYDAALLVNNY